MRRLAASQRSVGRHGSQPDHHGLSYRHPGAEDRPRRRLTGTRRACRAEPTEPEPQLHPVYSPDTRRAALHVQHPRPGNPQGTTSVTTNGSSYGVQGWLLDGTDNREPVDGIIVINPTLDSVGEMKVTSSNYDAEFGGAIGGIVSAQTKSGGNGLHGDVFFYRHSGAHWLATRSRNRPPTR